MQGIRKIEAHQEKPAGDSQLRKHVTIYNKDNEIVAEFMHAQVDKWPDISKLMEK
jgi:hypothetical protein